MCLQFKEDSAFCRFELGGDSKEKQVVQCLVDVHTHFVLSRSFQGVHIDYWFMSELQTFSGDFA